MKIQSFSRLLTATAILSGAAWLQTSPAQANPTSSFYCGVDTDGTPTTMVRHPQHGEVAVIRWVSDYFEASGYDPQTRCELVSQRFQNFKENDTLQYLTTGRMNRQSVVCVSPTNGGECAGLLFTLKPTSNPNQTLQDLMAVRSGATSTPLNETGARLYINLEDYIQEAAAQSTTDLESVEEVQSTEEGQSGSALW
jgi:hypothetical protein